MSQEKWAAMTITRPGLGVMERLCGYKAMEVWLPERLRQKGTCGPNDAVRYYRASIADQIQKTFHDYDHWIFVLPVSLVVRLIAPVIRDKHTDPSVTAIDDGGRYVVCLLSCHGRDGNMVTQDVAAWLGAEPVVTTGTESLNRAALDWVGREWQWFIENPQALPVMSRMALEGEPLGVVQESGPEEWTYRDHFGGGIYPWWTQVPKDVMHDMKGWLWITHRQVAPPLDVASRPILIYRPKVLCVGLGFSRNTPAEELERMVMDTFSHSHLSVNSVLGVATIDIKRHDEALNKFAARHHWAIQYFSPQQLNSVRNSLDEINPYVFHATGAYGVAEPAAILGSSRGKLLVPKTKSARVTVAVGLMPGGQHSSVPLTSR